MAQTVQPLLIEVEGRTWGEWLERVKPWLATTRTLQSAYRKMLEDTVEGVSEPHLRTYLSSIRETAREHEGKVDDLYRAFGLHPAGSPALGSATATFMAKTREVVGDMEGLAGGASGGGWRKLRVLLLTNLDSIGGFAVTEQLGLALGVPAVIDIVLPVIEQKTAHQLLMRESMLEMASNAILYRRDM